MLEPGPKGSDLYEHPTPDHLDSVYVEGNTEVNKSWEVERIISKNSNYYLVRWKG